MTLAIVVLSVLLAGSVQDKPPFAVAGCTAAAPVSFDNVKLPVAVTANGQSLAAGVYTVRITAQHPAPAVGQSVTCESWVEFVQKGAVAGRELASVMAPDDIKDVAKGPVPAPNTARVDVLKEHNYVRVWMNTGGMQYIVNLAIAR